jgi:GTP-binding protein LepA
LNKVDLPSANPEVSDDIIDLLGCKLEDIIHASGKTGFGVEIYWPIIEKFHHHQEVDEPLQALFDSHYNPFRGIEFPSEKRTNKKAKKLNLWLRVMNILLTKLVP